MEQLNETSTIVLNRKKSIVKFVEIETEVRLNGSKVTQLKNGGSESITIPAGTHTLAIIPVGFGSILPGSCQIMFVAQAGESYSFFIEPWANDFTIVLSGSSESIKKATLESAPSIQTEAVKQEQSLQSNDAEPLELLESEEQQILQEQQKPQDKVQVNFNNMYLDDEHNTLPPNPQAIVNKGCGCGCLIVILGIGLIIVSNVLAIYQDYQEEQRQIEYKERALELEKKWKEKRRYDEERTNPAYKRHRSTCLNIRRNQLIVSDRGDKDFFERRVLTKSEINRLYDKCMKSFKGKKYLYGPDS